MSVIVGTRIQVTQEMIDCGRLAYESVSEYPYSWDAVVAAYKAMRALEPGVADPGVMQTPHE